MIVVFFSSWTFFLVCIFFPKILLARVNIPNLTNSLIWNKRIVNPDIQYAIAKVPLFYDHLDGQDSLFHLLPSDPTFNSSTSKTINITVQRKCSNPDAKCERGIWLLLGGPGVDSELSEHKLIESYYSFLKNDVKESFVTDDFCVFIVHHRGTKKSTPLPTESNFSQTIQSLSRLLKDGNIDQSELDGFTSIQASFDVITLMNAIKPKENYIHGYSYGAYWAIQLTSQLAKLDTFKSVINIKSVVVDAGLPIGFYLNLHFKPNAIIHELLKNCQNSFICNNFASKQILQEGLEALKNGKCTTCITALKMKFPELEKVQKTPLEMFQLIFEMFLRCEEILVQTSFSPSSTHSKNNNDPDGNKSEIFNMDLRVLAIQLISHFANDCRNSYKFQIILDITRHIFNASYTDSLGVNGHDNISRQSLPAIQISLQEDLISFERKEEGARSISGAKEEIKAGIPFLRIFSPLHSSDSFSFNYLLFANIVYRELWNYGSSLLLPSSSSSTNSPNPSNSSLAPSSTFPNENNDINGQFETEFPLSMTSTNSLLQIHASSFRKYIEKWAFDHYRHYSHSDSMNSSSSNSQFSSLSKTSYLILSGALDYRTPFYASQKIYNDLVNSGNNLGQIVTFLNRGHVISNMEKKNDCSRIILHSFYLEGRVSEGALSCVQQENRNASLDWIQEKLIKNVGIHLWPSEKVGRWPVFIYYCRKILIIWPNVWIFIIIGILILIGIFLTIRFMFKTEIAKKRASIASL